jgi:hypothetical protein
MAFLFSHGVAASLGHLLGAGLHVTGYSPEEFLALHAAPALGAFLPSIGLTDIKVPETLEPTWLLAVTLALFWLLTMSGSRTPSEELAHTGLDDSIQQSVAEFRLLRFDIMCGYAVGFMLSQAPTVIGAAPDWEPLLYFPASAIGIPLALYVLMLLVAILFALFQRACPCCIPVSRTPADTWGRQADLHSPVRVLHRSAAMY